VWRDTKERRECRNSTAFRLSRLIHFCSLVSWNSNFEMKVNTILLVLECILFLFFVDNSTSTREIPITNETNLAALNVKPIVDHWQLYIRYGDPSNPLYVNNSAAELMSICGGLSGCDKLKLALNSTVVKEKICSRKNCIDPCTVKRLYNLCVAQVQVKNYQVRSSINLYIYNFKPSTHHKLTHELLNTQTVIEKKIRWIILLICQVLTCLAGFFLFVTGHFKFQNLPLIGNELLDRPTGGVNYFHFMWMRWIILGNTNTHVRDA